MGERPAQGLFASKLYTLKHVKAQEVAPVLEGALRKGSPDASAECLVQGGDSILITLPRKALPLADVLVKALDVPPVPPQQQLGVGYESYKPRCLSPKSAAKLIASQSVNGREGGCEVVLDPVEGIVYWKGTPEVNEAVARLMEANDKTQTQTRVILKAYRLTARGVQYLGEEILGKPESSVDDSILKYLATRRGASYVSSAECPVIQGIKSSSALLDAGSAGKFKITVVYPVVDTKDNGTLSIYTDFVFDYEGDTRCARWTLESGKEHPLAAFSLKGSPREKAFYLNMEGLPVIFRGKDQSSIAGDMLIISAFVSPSSE